MRRVQQKWEWVLRREWEDPQNSLRFCLMVVQTVLMYALGTWVMKVHIGRNLGGFHHRVARKMTIRKLRRGIDWRWRYPQLEEAME